MQTQIGRLIHHPIGIFTLLMASALSGPAVGRPNNLPHYPGLQMTARLDKGAYVIGEQVVLRVDIKNISEHRIVLGEGAYEHESIDLLIRRGDGVALPLTPYGKRLQTASGAVAANPLIFLRGGQVRQYHFDLTPMYGLQAAGNYSVTVWRVIFRENYHPYPHADNRFLITASPVHFAVKPR